jgi:hypothetical protein
MLESPIGNNEMLLYACLIFIAFLTATATSFSKNKKTVHTCPAAAAVSSNKAKLLLVHDFRILFNK